jgi:cytochrome P450
MTAPALSPSLFSPDFYHNPYPAFDWLRKHSPVHEFRFPVGDVPTFIVTRFDDVKALLGDSRFSTAGLSWASHAARGAGMVFAEGTVVESILTVLDPPDHTRVRKLAMSAFTPRRTEQWRQTVVRIVGEELNVLADQEKPDLMSFASAVPAKVTGEILGMPLDRFTDMLHAIDRAFGTDPEMLEDRTRAFVEIGEYGRELIAEKRRDPGEDLTSSFIQARDGDERLTEDELIAMLALMVMAGLDTSRAVIGTASLALLDFPDQRQMLLSNRELIAPAVEEFIRYEGAFNSALIRFATQDTDLHGTFIPAGSPVMASTLSANRDPSVFENPDRLNIQRGGPRHVGFGHGLHNCLGAAMARLEVAIAVPALFRRFPDMNLTVDRGETRWVPSWLIRSLAELPVDLGIPAYGSEVG